MKKQSHRILVVGASSLLGREIAEELKSGPLAAANIVLLDSDAEPGKLEEIAGEAAVLQAVEPASFEGADVVIFATAADAGKYWSDALSFGAASVDATATVRDLPVLAPQIGALRGSEPQLSLETNAVTAAHPAATMLAAVLLPLHKRATITGVFATVLQPVSENGAAALDELHQQTVSLLSFQSVPTEQHDVQVAFNLLPRLGEDAKLDLQATAQAAERHIRSLLGADVPAPVLQWVQAPVFHGYAISLFVTVTEPMSASSVQDVLGATDLVEVVAHDDPAASNIAVAGESNIQVELIEDRPAQPRTTLRLWLVSDNLKLLAHTSIGCAAELLRMRPTGAVQ